MNQIDYTELLNPNCKLNQSDLPAARDALWTKAKADADELQLLTGEATAIPNYDAFSNAQNHSAGLFAAISAYRDICNSVGPKLEAAKLAAINAAKVSRAAAATQPAPAQTSKAKATETTVNVRLDDGTVVKQNVPSLTQRILQAKGCSSLEELRKKSSAQGAAHGYYIPPDPNLREPKKGGATARVYEKLGVRNAVELAELRKKQRNS